MIFSICIKVMKQVNKSIKDTIIKHNVGNFVNSLQTWTKKKESKKADILKNREK